MLQTGKQVLKKASKGGYAVGHFNFSNLESLKAIVQAAQNTNSPVFAATSEGGIDYGGVDYLAAIAKIAAKNAKVPVVLHLDHGKDMRYINAAITHGYTSIMIDASSFPLKENIRITKKVVILCHQKGISVEAELGCLQGIEDKVSEKESIFTSPKEAVYFVKETGVDSLAISVGTSHGAYKFKDRYRKNPFDQETPEHPSCPPWRFWSASFPRCHCRKIWGKAWGCPWCLRHNI